MPTRFFRASPRSAHRSPNTEREFVLIPSRHWNRATWLLLCVACRADAPLTPPPPPVVSAVVIVSGDQQQADPLDVLDNPIQFKVLDGAGKPMPGTSVQLAIPVGGGTVPATTVTTDSSGFAQTLWTMGPYGGAQELEFLAGGKLLATATAATCDPSECFPPSRLSGALSDATLLTLATYDSSGQVVHPDIVRGHGGATGYWLAITPYPNSNTLFENPSIYRSSDAAGWTVPKGATNPLVKGAAPVYLSDPDMVIDNDNHLWMYYRSVTPTQNIIKVMRSIDGAHWDTSLTVITVPNHQVVSPTVVRAAPHAPWQMWSVNPGERGCSAPTTNIERRTSSDGIHWSGPSSLDLVQPGQTIWHIDVQWIAARAEYWALYNTYPEGTTCATTALYIARSKDGVSWTTYPSPIARAGIISAFKSLVYRSTFMTNPKATQVTLWISGATFANNAYTWSTANVTTTVAGLLAIASTPATLMQGAPSNLNLPPPEPDVGPNHQ